VDAGALPDVLLVKTVQKSGSDSVVDSYSYDANKRLSSLKREGTDDQGNFLNTEYYFHRNASGIITDYSAIDPSLFVVGIDSISTIVHYSNSRYSSYVVKITVPGFLLLDSSVLVYDGAGRVIGENDYQSPSATGQDYYMSGKITYSYSANGNLTGFVLHDYNQSGSEIFRATTSNIRYDTKINPLHFGNEAFVLGHSEWFSANNITSEQLSDSISPSDDQTVTTTYNYNNGGRPETSVTTVAPDNTVINTAYYYQ